jgi:hypothetical protein
MKQWAPVKVLWRDAHGGDNGWEEPERIHHGPFTVTTVGMLYKQDDSGVTIVHNQVDESVGGYTFVPAENLISIKELK